MSPQKLIPYIHTDSVRWDHYFVDSKTGIIYYEQRLNNRKFKFSTHETNPVKAKRFANAHLEAILGKKKIAVRTLISEEIELYQKVKLAEGLSLSREQEIVRGLKQIKPYWGKKLPSEITQDSLPDFYEWWTKTHPDLQMTTALKALKGLAFYMHRKIINGHSMVPAVPVMKDPNRSKIKAATAKKKQRILTHQEVQKILSTARNEAEHLLILIMFTMATRVEETLQMEFGQTVILDQAIPIYRWYYGSNKADLTGQHALHSSLIEPLKALHELRKSQGTSLLFPQVLNNQKPLKEQQIDWNDWRDRANLGWHWTPHTFRHTCLSYLFNDATLPQAGICKQYRISIQVAMQTYIKITEETMLKLSDSIKVDFK